MKRQVRYLRTHVKGEPFSFDVVRVQYRDSKGRLSKFTTKKKLKPEAVFATEAVNKKTGKITKKYFTSKKHTLPLVKRKSPVSVARYVSLIKSRLHREKRTFIETEMTNLYRFTYLYNQKRKTLGRVKKKTKAEIKKQKVKSVLSSLKGSTNESRKSLKTSVSRNQALPRRIHRTTRSGVRYRNRKR